MALTSASGRIRLAGGSAVHTLAGTGSYWNLELNDVNGATLSGSPTVNGTLTIDERRFRLGQ